MICRLQVELKVNFPTTKKKKKIVEAGKDSPIIFLIVWHGI